jgi:hypothetical protein
MELFTRAAAIALSVLASLFTNVEPPRPAASAAPAVRQVALPKPAEPKKSVVVCTDHAGSVRIAVFQPLPRVAEPDAETQRFLDWIGKGQTTAKPIAVKPWFAQTDAFAAPTADILRALISNDRDR